MHLVNPGSAVAPPTPVPGCSQGETLPTYWCVCKFDLTLSVLILVAFNVLTNIAACHFPLYDRPSSMQKFDKKNPFSFMEKTEKNILNNSCIPLSSLDASTKFQADSMKSDCSQHAFLAPTMHS